MGRADPIYCKRKSLRRDGTVEREPIPVGMTHILEDQRGEVTPGSSESSGSQSSQRLALETVVVEDWRSDGYLGAQESPLGLEKSPLPATAGR